MLSPRFLPYEVIGRTTEMGRTRITLVCPICGAHVTAFVWSLSGSGKRCGCGAKHGSMGTQPPAKRSR